MGVNFGTDISATSAVVKYGPAGGTCNTSTATATRTFMLVNGVSEYQWKAQLTGLAATRSTATASTSAAPSSTCWAPTRLRCSRPRSPPAPTAPFKFAVFGDWGKTLAAGNPDQANVISQIAASGARFAVTTGDNAYEAGSQKDYGDLYQTGDNTSAVFGPNYWKVAGASLPLFPALGNHDYNNSVAAHELAAGHRRGRAPAGATRPTPTAARTAPRPTDYPSGWYAFDAGLARFYVLTAAWDDSNSGTADPVQERLRQPLGAQFAAVPVARERPRHAPAVGAVRLLALPVRLRQQRGRA